MAHDVFVSHSEKDKAVTDAVVARLEAESVRCWVAPRDVVPGADWGESIIDAIESSRIMILIFSKDANASPQIKREVERAVDKGVYTIPFRIDDIEPTRSLEYFISTAQWMDAFSPPLEPHLDTLAKTVTAILKVPVSAAPAQPEKTAATKVESVPVSPAKTERTAMANRERRQKSIIVGVGALLVVIVMAVGWYAWERAKASPNKRTLSLGNPPVLEHLTPTGATEVAQRLVAFPIHSS
jgi:hypothetical protein